MGNRFVVDTTALISYFEKVFEEKPKVSQKALSLIEQAFNDEGIILIIPSIVFIEIFKKFYNVEERCQKIRYEIYERIKSQSNMEIRPFGREELENFIKIVDIEKYYNFDNHDKQILAVAMMLQCPLITSDLRIIRYNERKNVIPKVIS